MLCSIEGSRLIDALEVGHKGLLILAGHILDRVSDLMNNAVLNLGIGVNAFNGLREAFKTIDTGNEDILNATVIEVCQYAEPMVSAFLV